MRKYKEHERLLCIYVCIYAAMYAHIYVDTNVHDLIFVTHLRSKIMIFGKVKNSNLFQVFKVMIPLFGCAIDSIINLESANS